MCLFWWLLLWKDPSWQGPSPPRSMGGGVVRCRDRDLIHVWSSPRTRPEEEKSWPVRSTFLPLNTFLLLSFRRRSDHKCSWEHNDCFGGNAHGAVTEDCAHKTTRASQRGRSQRTLRHTITLSRPQRAGVACEGKQWETICRRVHFLSFIIFICRKIQIHFKDIAPSCVNYYPLSLRSAIRPSL